VALNPFLGETRANLESWLAIARKDLALGKTVSSAGAGDVNTANQIQMTPLQRIELLLRALNSIDPVTYPATSIRRVTRTQVTVYPVEAYR
jgi:hypothetical protein